ncbi:PLP-dependent aminotransferase family protein [Primorskyibacter sp. S187A]|uniref:MocR-like pyridoxine biosynthesis transcription factor PdxR n=1 Tax=Primorskyibacter sp. S187A TaxID=3415130 RepID=UPI003C7A6C2F
MSLPIEAYFLDPHSHGTLQTRIQQMIANNVLTGLLRPGDKLPSSRKLAQHLGVSRITVTLAYTELLANDYLTAKGRSGYFVSDNAPDPTTYRRPPKRVDAVDWARALPQRMATQATALKPADWQSYRYPFVYGQTDPSLFDHANWRLCALQALGARDFSALTSDYHDADDPELTSFLIRQTLPRRGIYAEPEEVLVTLGAQNALWLAAQVLLSQRRTAALEEPGYPALRDILKLSRCHLSMVEVDADGLPPEHIPGHTDVIFCTPSHHCPTAATMPLARRDALLERAREIDALIVEDDYEFEIASKDNPSPALKSLDTEGRVIYVGSFSKSLFPGLRLGYLVASAAFIREARALRATVLRHPPGHLQRTAAYFLARGHYDALVRKISRALTNRRRAMLAGIARHGLNMAGTTAEGGSSLWMRAPEGVDTQVLADRLRTEGVLIEPGHTFFGQSNAPRCFYRLGYSSISEARIEPGLARVAAAINAVASETAQ